MTPSEIRLLNWLLLALGAALVFSGWRTIIRRRTRTQYGHHVGRVAARLGCFWLLLGLLLLVAALARIPILKAVGRIFLESDA
jgi:hypothetical protein